MRLITKTQRKTISKLYNRIMIFFQINKLNAIIEIKKKNNLDICAKLI